MHQKLTVSEIPYPDWPLQSLSLSITLIIKGFWTSDLSDFGQAHLWGGVGMLAWNVRVDLQIGRDVILS